VNIGKVAQRYFGDVGLKATRRCIVADFFRFSCGFHKEVQSSTVCAQPTIDFLLR
jgi:hypothetical protein